MVSNIVIIKLTYLSLMRGIFQLQVGCHAWPNTTEYIADYSKQNETDFRFIG